MTRHPITGQLINDESAWKNSKGEWLGVNKTPGTGPKGEKTFTHEPIPEPVEDQKGGDE